MTVDKADVIALLGEPDRILPRGKGMVSRTWSCSTCRKLHQFPEPVRPPAPCQCGGIAFELAHNSSGDVGGDDL